MKYIPSIAFEEMSGSAKGVTAAKVFFKYFYVDSATGETSVPMQTMVKWAQTKADPDPDEP